MNKKQRNRKEVKQNKRNKIVNRRYSSTIKTLIKFFIIQINNVKLENKNYDKEKIEKLKNLLFSFIDKASKKNVIHKNNAARKKARICRIFSNLKI